MSKHPFVHQASTGPDKDLCAFFALYHLKNGDLTREHYLNVAAAHYVSKIPGIDSKLARKIALDGNDPAVYDDFGLKRGNETAIEKADDVIVCVQKKEAGHFISLKKIDGEWWNYDSLQKQPSRIGSADQAKRFCGHQVVYY